MEDRKFRVAITQGDTNGVGYEQIFKTFEDQGMMELCTPIIYGSPKVATYHRKVLNSQTQFCIISAATEAKENRLNLLTTSDEEVKVELGQSTPDSNEAARVALKKAIQDVQQGLVDVLVTTPDCLPDFLSKEPEVLRIRIVDDVLRMALVTNLMAIKDVPESITKQKIMEKLNILFTCLRRDLRINNPRIAVLSLNPPATEDGKWGEEENEIIIPAIDELVQSGIQVFGPYASDSFFGSDDYLKFDAVLAMYYDQGMAPLNALAVEDSVSLITGMPFVWTRPEGDARFDIAGKGLADEAGLRHAIFMAIDVARNRTSYDEPLQNPLPKLYKEKRDESEKVRFSVPKSKEARPSEIEKNQ